MLLWVEFVDAHWWISLNHFFLLVFPCPQADVKFLHSYQDPQRGLWLLSFPMIIENCQCKSSQYFLLFVHHSCFGIKSPISKIMCIQSLIIAIKSKRYHLLKIKFIWSNTQHTIFNKCRPVNILYFTNNNWPILRLKSFLWVCGFQI